MGLTLHLFLLPLLLVGGIVAIVFARRKRVGLEPHCVGCDFSLQGLPETTDRCPECGRRIHADGVAIGKRTPSRPLIVTGIALLLLALPSLLATGALLTGNRVATLMPTFVLLSQADDDPNAMRELIARNAASPLKPSDLNRATAQALAAQGNIALAWDPAWGDWIEARQAAGQLSAADWSRYLLQSVPQPKFTIQRRLRPDAGINGKCFIQHIRLGNASRVRLLMNNMTLELGSCLMQSSYDPIDLVQGDLPVRYFVATRLPTDATSGPGVIRLTAPYTIISGVTQVSGTWTSDGDVRVFARDEASFERIKSPELAASVRARVSTHLFYLDEDRLVMEMQMNDVGVHVSYRILFHVDGIETDTGARISSSGIQRFNHSWHVAAPKRDLAKVDLILRPDEDEADRMDYPRILDEEIVFKDVAIKPR